MNIHELEAQFVASSIMMVMDKNHFEKPVRIELMQQLRTIGSGILSLGKIRKAEYLRQLDQMQVAIDK